MDTKTGKAREKIFRESKQMFQVNTFLSKHTKEACNSYSYETSEIKRSFDSFYSLTVLA